MNKQISKGVMLSFIAQGVAVLVNLVYTPLMVRILGQYEYGLYQVVQSVVNYLNLMNFGFTGAYIHFYSLEKARPDSSMGVARLNGMFLRIFLFITLICLAAGAFLVQHIEILGTKLTEADYVTARKLMILLALNMAVSFPNSVFTVYVAANERFVFKQATTILLYVLIPLCNLPVLWLGFGSTGVAAVTLGLSLLRLGLNMGFCLGRLKMQFRFGRFDKALLFSLVSFTFFIFLSDIVDQLNTNVDKFLLVRIIGADAVAIYSVGFELSTYFTFCSWVIPEMFIPEANRIAVEEKDDRKLTELFTRIGRYNNYILLLVLTGFILVGRPFIRLWVGDGYETSYLVGVILMLSRYIPAVQTMGVTIQNAKDMHRPRSVIYLGIAILNVAVSILLIRWWGVTGTSLGTLAAVILGAGLFMNIYYHRRIGLNVFIFWKSLARWTPLAALLCAASWAVTRNISLNSWPQLLLFILIYSAIYILLLWYAGMKKAEKAEIRRSLAALRKRTDHDGERTA